MMPRYEWTPASEPPDTERMIIVYGYHVENPHRPYWSDWMHILEMGFDDGSGFKVTHWRDIEPPSHQ